MILHLFPKSQFTEEFIEFINNNFIPSEHLFVLYTNIPFELSEGIFKYDNVEDYDEHNLLWFFYTVIKCDRVILHNFGLQVKELFLFSMFYQIPQKSIWLIWGSDLYCYLNPKDRLSDKLVEWLRARTIKRFPIIASLTDGDYSLAVRWYGCTGRNIRLDYCEEKTIRIMNDFMQNKRKDDGIVRILVGNSATKTNQHKEVFDMLAHLKDKNIMLYVPLSYGDNNYAIQIEDYGKSIFGEKFVPLTRFMSREEYYRMLYDVDVGVFNNNRQQGTGNIEALLYFGRKIYIRDDTSMWMEWVKKEGYILNNVKELYSVDINELKIQTKHQMETNARIIHEFFDINERINEWDEAFRMPLSI